MINALKIVLRIYIASLSLALFENTYRVHILRIMILATLVTQVTEHGRCGPSSGPLPEDIAPQPHHRDIKLPSLRTTRPRAWFTFMESYFQLGGIEDDPTKFDHMLSALPAAMISQVINIVDNIINYVFDFLH
jgi:hypothetical protein